MALYDSFIFAGHGTSESTGKFDPGAAAQGARESDLTKLFMEEAKKELSSNSLTKKLSIHYDEQNFVDNDLNGNTYKVKAGVSIHINAGGGTGTEVWSPCKEKDLSHDISLSANLANVMGIPNRGVKSRDYNTGNTFKRVNGQALNYLDYYKEIRQAWEKGISLSILEVGFIDTGDLAKMKAKTKEIGFEIAKYIAALNGITLVKQSSSSATTSTTNKAIYRVRKTWADASSQKGAFSDLYNAKKCADQNSGYYVFDENGKSIYPVASLPEEYEIKRYSEKGKCTVIVKEGIFFYNQPKISTVTGSYEYNESVNYDLVVQTNKYVYISWVSASQGVRRYMPVRVVSTGERWGKCV